MVMATMSHFLLSYLWCLFLVDFSMLEMQLFWVNSSCQETKHQPSTFAKAFSCLYALGLFFFLLKEELELEVDDLRFDKATLTLLIFCCFH